MFADPTEKTWEQMQERLCGAEASLCLNGSIHAERRPSGRTRFVVRYRERESKAGHQRSLILAYDLPPELVQRANKLLAHFQRRRHPEKSWPAEAREIVKMVLELFENFSPRNGRFIRKFFRACDGDFRKLMHAALLLDKVLADRRERRRGGRPRKDEPKDIPEMCPSPDQFGPSERGRITPLTPGSQGLSKPASRIPEKTAKEPSCRPVPAKTVVQEASQTACPSNRAVVPHVAAV